MDHNYRDMKTHDYVVAEGILFHLHLRGQFIQTQSAMRPHLNQKQPGVDASAEC
jgi:hypothetical protein